MSGSIRHLVQDRVDDQDKSDAQFQTAVGCCSEERRMLAEDGDPAQPRLRAFKDEEFEVPSIIVQRDAPFLIGVGDVERIRAAPFATFY